MFRFLLLMMALLCLPAAGMAEAPLTFADDLKAVYTWPEGSTVEEAAYVYRAVYPQIAGDSALAMTINNVFQYEASDALGFECPMIGSSHDPALGQMQVTLSYEITHLSEQYLCVRVDKQVVAGDVTSHVVKAFDFGLTGEKAGTVTSLPYLLGLMKPGETDEWYVDRQTLKADTCAREMVWAEIQKAQRDAGLQLYDDLTYEEFEWCFYPEEDFYLDAEGNFVFFIQENVIAPQAAGQFFFTVSMDDMLDEI